MEKTVRVGLLYEFYYSLLTKKQQELIELYHYEDLSLSEIGESLDISKQAVSDQLARATEKMEDLESNLKILAHNTELVKSLHEVIDLLAKYEDKPIVKSRGILQGILESLQSQ